MPVDRGELLELYSIALEEARHRDRLYTQTWIAVAISAAVFFAAVGLFLKQPSIISECCMTGFKFGLVFLGTFLGLFFTYAVFRLAKEGDICRCVALRIEGALLTGREQIQAPELKDLLVRQKIDETKPRTKREYIKYVKWVCKGQGWRRVYPSTIFLAWIVFCIFVFICID